MVDALVALFFIGVLVLFFAFCVRERDAIRLWLNKIEPEARDPKLDALRENVTVAMKALKKQDRRLQIESEIKAANKELEALDDAETWG